MTSPAKSSQDHSHPDPLSGYQAAVGNLLPKFGQIATNSHQTCKHLSRAVIALRSMARKHAK